MHMLTLNALFKDEVETGRTSSVGMEVSLPAFRVSALLSRANCSIEHADSRVRYCRSSYPAQEDHWNLRSGRRS